ncbi:hypothetical protein [Tenacibaculum agarivorans]|uniref:hypothetical protein n=1 Tax=Tenacibaculum agarivorans TaxID=1908389 RepID=UPI00094BB9D9|nr:hypothetical protein [Tenacibaculum agarivorans]
MKKKFRKSLLMILAAIAAMFFFTRRREKKFENVKDKGTLTDDMALSIANEAQKAMKGLGTSEQTLANILLPLTEANFNKVFDQFGKRKYRKLFYNEDWNLAQWLKEELKDEKEIKPYYKFTRVRS